MLMWVMSRDGFFSAVQNEYCSQDEVQVRARCKDDLKALMRVLGIKQKIKTTPDADYLYRIKLTKRQWADYLAETATNIHYSNFKNASCRHDHVRGRAYMECWSALFAWQERIKKRCSSTTKSRSFILR